MKKVITIQGMKCSHCEKSVTEVLKKLRGVTKVEVSLKDKTATIEMRSKVEDKEIKKVIEEIGFEVKEIREK